MRNLMARPGETVLAWTQILENVTMPRSKGSVRRRVQVTLSHESWALVEEIAELTRTPKASILAEIFDVTLPSFASTMAALRLAQEQPREALRLVQNFASKSVMELQQQNLELNAELSAQEVKKRKRRRVRIAST